MKKLDVEISAFNYGRNRALYELTAVNLNKQELPDELSHEEVTCLQDLDSTLLEITTDD